MRDWWLDEVRFAGEEHLDPGYVAGYDAKAMFDPSADIELLGRHGLGPGTRLLDLGAGTGVFAVAAAATGAEVTAVDVSPAMVAALRRRVGESSAAGSVRVVECGLLDHAGEPADFVFARNVLHQLPDFWKVLALHHIATLVRPGGILRLRDLVYDVDPADAAATIDEWLARAPDPAGRGYSRRDLADHVRHEFSTFTWLLEAMLDRSGFDVVDRTVQGSVHAAYTCRRRR